MLCIKPALTATNAEFLFQPVANALGSGELNIPTSGIPMPAFLACSFTVLTSHCSVSLAGCSITCTPIERLAIDLDINNEIKAPLKPMTADIISNWPFPANCMPKTLVRIDITTVKTTIMAAFVAKNRNILCINFSL